MPRHKERRVFTFRKDEFSIVYQFYQCGDSDEKFTDDELDNLNLKLVHNQYRAKFGIPFTDEIREIRMKYGLSALKMSEVLGFGANVYRNYEAGEMPSVTSGRLIRLMEDSREFKKMLEMSKNVFEPEEFEKVKKKVEHHFDESAIYNEQFEGWLFGSTMPNIYNGYKMPNIRKAGNMVQFFAKHNKPFVTGLNKLMFYADFGHFKQHGNSISGLVYKAIQRGPVPADYGKIYNEMVNRGFVKIREVTVKEFVGEQLYGGERKDPVNEIFSESELTMLQKVSQKFQGWSASKIVDASHTEKAWQHNAEDFGRISYEYSFDIKHLE